jgi:hypothetical protein
LRHDTIAAIHHVELAGGGVRVRVLEMARFVLSRVVLTSSWVHPTVYPLDEVKGKAAPVFT